MAKLVTKENYLRNLLIDYIKYDKEMTSLRISMNGDDVDKVLHQVNNFRKNEPDITKKDIRTLKREMNRELNKCLRKISGYPPYH